MVNHLRPDLMEVDIKINDRIMQLWIRRVDNINDDPARFSTEIDQACIDALAGKPMIGLINAVGPK